MKTVSRVTAIAWGCAVLLAGPGRAQDLRITEVMSSSGSGGTVDWFELTNYGLTVASIAGWTMDDSSFLFANSVALNGVASIGAGESVIFLESAGGADIASFRTFWGGIDSVQIGYYSGSGVGFSASGDGAVVFNSGGTEATPEVTFGAATAGSSFYFTYDAEDNPAASVSQVGTVAGQVTYISADTLGNIGSPGTAMGIPEPATGTLLGLGALGLVRRWRRKIGPAA